MFRCAGPDGWPQCCRLSRSAAMPASPCRGQSVRLTESIRRWTLPRRPWLAFRLARPMTLAATWARACRRFWRRTRRLSVAVKSSSLVWWGGGSCAAAGSPGPVASPILVDRGALAGAVTARDVPHLRRKLGSRGRGAKPGPCEFRRGSSGSGMSGAGRNRAHLRAFPPGWCGHGLHSGRGSLRSSRPARRAGRIPPGARCRAGWRARRCRWRVRWAWPHPRARSPGW